MKKKIYNIYRVNGKVETIEREDFISLQEMQSIVGGYIQMCFSSDGEIILVCNEEGKFLGQRMNATATRLAHKLQMISTSDYIVGDVIMGRRENFD